MSTGYLPLTKSSTGKKYSRAITFGTFDLFHVGHVRILKRVADLADEVIVGVSSDELNMKKKNRLPVCSFADRLEIILACRHVSGAFSEDSLEMKRDYIKQFGADLLVMGDDWQGKFDFCLDLCDVIYLPRTELISTTEIIDGIVSNRLQIKV